MGEGEEKLASYLEGEEGKVLDWELLEAQQDVDLAHVLQGQGERVLGRRHDTRLDVREGWVEGSVTVRNLVRS